jgi:flavodoxin
MPRKSSPNRKPGGQPGNLNALKHGFYSRGFNELELSDLEVIFETGLQSELAMLRVAIRRFFDLTDGTETLETAGQTLSLLSMAAGKLAAITRIQHMLGGDQKDEIVQEISKAIDIVMKEMNIHL